MLAGWYDGRLGRLREACWGCLVTDARDQELVFSRPTLLFHKVNCSPPDSPFEAVITKWGKQSP